MKSRTLDAATFTDSLVGATADWLFWVFIEWTKVVKANQYFAWDTYSFKDFFELVVVLVDSQPCYHFHSFY